MGDEDSSSSPSIPSDLYAILEAHKNVILSAVNTQIQGLQSNSLKAQTDLASQIASEMQPETYVFKKKGNEQQFNFNRKVINRPISAAGKALESGSIGKAKEELNEGICTLNNRNAFQTKMWYSNLGKFRRVLVFVAEKVCVSEGFG